MKTNQGVYSGDFINFAYMGEGNNAQLLMRLYPHQHHEKIASWILVLQDMSQAHEFGPYTQYPPTSKETIQTADGTAQPVRGVGTVQCTASNKLSSVLHVPAFPINFDIFNFFS